MIPFIVVAGGVGKRLKADEPKQYIELGGKPILYHTVKALVDAGVEDIILVLDPTYTKRVASFLAPFKEHVKISYAANGPKRQDSVKNGLALVPKETLWVAIHDGVRPFVSKDLIQALLEARGCGQCVIPVTPLKDTIKEIEGDIVKKTLDRSKLFGAGTPQLVDYKFYREALIAMDGFEMTDEASLIEAYGGQVNTVLNSQENIKITTPLDLVIGEAILRR